MSASLGKSLRLSSSLKILDEEAKLTEKQGIVSILGSDNCERGKAASLRRTLSADMSSKKWLAQHGFSPMKKIASSEELLVSIADSSSSSSEGEEDYEERKELEKKGLFDMCSSIQSEEEKMKKKELEKQGQFDTWSSILSQKADEDLSKSMPLPAPYIHPLVKKSSSSLSEKSLEICTESLGSETGSEGFSSYPPSEIGDTEENKEEEQQHQEEERQEEEEKVSQPFEKEEFQFVKYNCPQNKKSPPKSFPPPLPSLSRQDGASLHMRSHRKNGRLVLEAVSIPSQSYFRAQRQDGRLLLTFVNNPTSQEPNEEEVIEEEEEKDHEVFDEELQKFYEEEKEMEGETEDEELIDVGAEEEEEEEEEEEVIENVGREMGIGIEQAPKLASEVMNVPRPALMMNKLIRLANRNPNWPHKFNKVAKFEEEEEEEEEPITPQPQSLPPRPRVGRLIPSPPTAAAASFNAYEYCWRTKPTAAATILNPLTQNPPPPLLNNNNLFIKSKNPKAQQSLPFKGNKQSLPFKGNKADHQSVTFSRGCKEPRRSLLFWEPYCVATS